MVCYSNLHFVSMMDKTAFLIGRDKDLRLNIEFKNSGELSFNTGLQVTFPNIFAYSGLTEEQFSERVICSSVSTSVNDSILSCDLESPLYAYMVVNITMYFYLANDIRINTENIPSSDLTFTSSVSSDHETDSSDNQETLILPLALLTDVSFIVWISFISMIIRKGWLVEYFSHKKKENVFHNCNRESPRGVE